MDETPRFSPDFVRAVALGTGGVIGKQVAEQAAEYQKLLIFADQCDISRAVVDAKLLTASVRQAFDWIASGEARMGRPIDEPRTWTALVSGRYHIVSGQEPHLARDCTEVCQGGAELPAGQGETLHFMNSGALVEVPVDVVTVPWDHE